LATFGRFTVVRTCLGLADFGFLAWVVFAGWDDWAKTGFIAHKLMPRKTSARKRRGC